VREVDVVVDLEVDPDGAGPLVAYTLTGTLEHPLRQRGRERPSIPC